MRSRFDSQQRLDFREPRLPVTEAYYQRYETISNLLDDSPGILDAVHRDLQAPLKYECAKEHQGTSYKFTSDNVLRALLVLVLEGVSLRRGVILIDDSRFLRRFVRIYDEPMMDYSTLSKLKNSIRPETWQKANRLLAKFAVEKDLISGDRLRLDTTAVPTNIHHPTDSGLLWDCYRVLGRIIRTAREFDPATVGARRLHEKRAKRLFQKIARTVGKKNSQDRMKSLYSDLIAMVRGVLEWSGIIEDNLNKNLERGKYQGHGALSARSIVESIQHFRTLAARVRDQATRRVIWGESVPNAEKLFSIFEEHTELLKRGKAWSSIEYGHMIELEQVSEKFITHYEVFETRPADHALLQPAVERHKKLFGYYPDVVAADKGYYEREIVGRVEKKVRLVSIGKKGRGRTQEEESHEHSHGFRLAQKFRAGIEGSISFLKRVLGLWRCFNKGWTNYVSTIGITILAHNFLKLVEL